MTRRSITHPTTRSAFRVASAPILAVAVLVTNTPSSEAAAKPDPKICAQIVAIATLNKTAETARFDAGSDSEKNFLAALKNATTGLVSAHTELAKHVPAKDRPGVNYALARVKKLSAKVAKTNATKVLSVFGPWTTEDIANFDVTETKNAYLTTMDTLGKACGTKVRVFLI
jgi:hypothetical protein